MGQVGPVFFSIPLLLMFNLSEFIEIIQGEREIEKEVLILFITLIVSLVIFLAFYVASIPIEIGVDLSDDGIRKRGYLAKEKFMAWEEVTAIMPGLNSIRLHAGQRFMRVYPRYYKNGTEFRDFLETHIPNGLVLPADPRIR